MSRKISDFFTKTSMKIESIMEESNEGENSGKIIENVKIEAEKQLLVILPNQKIHKLPVPVKIEDNEPKVEELNCQICDKKYLKKSNLLNHIRNVHENPVIYKCDICKVRFNAKETLRTHQRTHMKNRPKPFKCDKCDFATDIKSSFKRHVKTHEMIIERCDKCNKKLLKNKIHDCRLDCKYCGKKFSHRKNVTEHIRNIHANESEKLIYECDICGLKFIKKFFLKSHMDKKHADGKLQSFTCDLDGKTFNFKRQIAQHMKSHFQPVKCDFCYKEVNVRHLKKHIMNFHTGIKPPKEQKRKAKNGNYQCQICSKTFPRKQNLERHVSDHNKTIKCKFCDKLFGSKSSLRVHIINYHENPKGHICNICGKKYTQRSSLKTHMKTHDPNRPRDFKCTQCDYATNHKITFKAHMNFHKRKNAEIAAMKNPHKCPQCPTVKDSQNSLKTHISSVHPKTIFECDICGRKMKTKGGLLRHLREVHRK